MGRAFPMTGAIVNLICHLTVSNCDDSRRVPRTLIVGVCQLLVRKHYLKKTKDLCNSVGRASDEGKNMIPKPDN